MLNRPRTCGNGTGPNLDPTEHIKHVLNLYGSPVGSGSSGLWVWVYLWGPLLLEGEEGERPLPLGPRVSWSVWNSHQFTRKIKSQAKSKPSLIGVRSRWTVIDCLVQHSNGRFKCPKLAVFGIQKSDAKVREILKHCLFMGKQRVGAGTVGDKFTHIACLLHWKC